MALLIHIHLIHNLYENQLFIIWVRIMNIYKQKWDTYV